MAKQMAMIIVNKLAKRFDTLWCQKPSKLISLDERPGEHSLGGLSAVNGGQGVDREPASQEQWEEEEEEEQEQEEKNELGLSRFTCTQPLIYSRCGFAR